MRRISALLLVLALPLLVAAGGRVEAPGALSAAGWFKGVWQGIPPARFEPLPSGGLHILAQPGEASFVSRRIEGTAACAFWRWRVDHGPPPTPLDRRGGDRAMTVAFGFDGWAPSVTAWQRTRHAVAQAAAGEHRLARSVLLYVWGGTGQEPQLFANPYMGGFGRVSVLRPAATSFGLWFDERIDLAEQWRSAFGGATPPPLLDIVISTDGDDTRTRIDARIERLRVGACPR